jgi:hypothetical protein
VDVDRVWTSTGCKVAVPSGRVEPVQSRVRPTPETWWKVHNATIMMGSAKDVPGAGTD